MWIRSQDRMNLVEVKRLTAYEKQGKFRIINQVLYLGDISDDYDILGEYESKERAIEVLNEIQNEISNCVKFTHTTESLPKPEGNISNTSTSYIVYQMPER